MTRRVPISGKKNDDDDDDGDGDGEIVMVMMMMMMMMMTTIFGDEARWQKIKSDPGHNTLAVEKILLALHLRCFNSNCCNIPKIHFSAAHMKGLARHSHWIRLLQVASTHLLSLAVGRIVLTLRSHWAGLLLMACDCMGTLWLPAAWEAARKPPESPDGFLGHVGPPGSPICLRSSSRRCERRMAPGKLASLSGGLRLRFLFCGPLVD